MIAKHILLLIPRLVIIADVALALATPLSSSIVDGWSDNYPHLPTSSSCSSEPQHAVSNTNTTTMISEPHKYFPAQVQRIVGAANAINPDAIELPKNYSYPVINISSWINPSTSSEEERLHVVKQVLKEASSNGSFNIVGHSIEDTLFKRLHSSSKSFFSMSLEQKLEYSTGSNYIGYVASRKESAASVHKTDNPKEQKDLRELFSMSYPPNFDGNIQGPPNFQDAMAEYMEQLHSVEQALNQIFTAALSTAKGVDLPITYLQDVEKDSTAWFRVSRYTNTPGFEDATKLLAHNDVGTFTIISSTEEEGLEEIRDGRWYKVPMKEGQLHVNIGEVYTMWSNNLFKSNVHRVSKQAKDGRTSFTLFPSRYNKVDNSEGVGSTGINPVCSEGEVAIFPRISTIEHSTHYMRTVMGKDNLYSK